MPSSQTISPSSKLSRPGSRARPSDNAIHIPRALSPSPPGSSPASAAGPATTESRAPRSCASASSSSTPSSTALPWSVPMCESDSRYAGGEGTRSDGDNDSVVPRIGAAIQAVVVHADAMHGGEAEGVGAAHHRVALPLQLALDLPLDAVGDVDRVGGGRETRRAHRLDHGHVEVEG